MPTYLYVPWFRPEALEIPLPAVGPLPAHLEVHPFGARVAMGVLIGTSLANRRARAEGLHPSVLGEMVAYVLIGGFVLGHMLDSVFYHWEVVREDPIFVLQVWNGLSSFGGFCGAALGGILWKIVRRDIPLVPFGDITSYAFPFGWLFGRLGCFVVHDHPGHVTDFPLAVADYQIRGQLPPWQVRHDLGLYEVLWCLAVIPLFLYLGRKKRPRGFYLALLPILYAPIRFGLDFLRATDIGTSGDPRIALGLTPGHFGAILLFCVGIGVAVYVLRGGRSVIPRHARWTAEDEGTPDPRGVEELLADVGKPRGPRRLDAPEAVGPNVQRWPGGLVMVDLREVSDWDSVADELEAGDAPEVQIWRLPESGARDDSARLFLEEHAREKDVVFVASALSREEAEGLASELAMPVFRVEDEELPFAVVERDDGGVVAGLVGAPDAQPT